MPFSGLPRQPLDAVARRESNCVPRSGSVPARGRVAQLVEQRIENPRVVGSIPTPATTSLYVRTDHMGNGLFRRHRQHLSIEGVGGALEVRALVVEEPQVVMHEGDEPDALADLFDADGLAGQGLAEADLFSIYTEPAAAGNRDGFVVEVT